MEKLMIHGPNKSSIPANRPVEPSSPTGSGGLDALKTPPRPTDQIETASSLSRRISDEAQSMPPSEADQVGALSKRKTIPTSTACFILGLGMASNLIGWGPFAMIKAGLLSPTWHAVAVVWTCTLAIFPICFGAIMTVGGIGAIGDRVVEKKTAERHV